MKEAYCSFEVAKLLKEKGFDEPCRSYFIDNVDYIDSSYSIEELTNLHMGVWETLRPTHQMACAWLREKHNVCIIIYPDKENGYEAVLYDTKNDVKILLQSFGVYGIHIYEEILESAIKYCLENLI